MVLVEVKSKDSLFLRYKNIVERLLAVVPKEHVDGLKAVKIIDSPEEAQMATCRSQYRYDTDDEGNAAITFYVEEILEGSPKLNLFKLRAFSDVFYRAIGYHYFCKHISEPVTLWYVIEVYARNLQRKFMVLRERCQRFRTIRRVLRYMFLIFFTIYLIIYRWLLKLIYRRPGMLLHEKIAVFDISSLIQVGCYKEAYQLAIEARKAYPENEYFDLIVKAISWFWCPVVEQGLPEGQS